MPLPRNFISFHRRALPAGFTTAGIVETDTSIKAPDGPTYGPVAGRYFLRLDDPFAVDAYRNRLDPGAAANLVGLTATSPRSQVPTLAADGAKLICENVTLNRGQHFQFAWNFMCWGDLPWNDFAIFEAKPDNGGPSSRIFLSDIAELAHANQRSTGWRIVTWAVISDFTGTLEWTVANGQQITNPAMVVPNPLAFTNPPALLVDAIQVS